MTSSRCTNGWDQAQSEQLHFGDCLVGGRSLRVVSVMATTVRSFPRRSLRGHPPYEYQPGHMQNGRRDDSPRRVAAHADPLHRTAGPTQDAGARSASRLSSAVIAGIGLGHSALPVMCHTYVGVSSLPGTPLNGKCLGAACAAFAEAVSAEDSWLNWKSLHSMLRLFWQMPALAAELFNSRLSKPFFRRVMPQIQSSIYNGGARRSLLSHRPAKKRRSRSPLRATL